jgi:hypothetical protein
MEPLVAAMLRRSLAVRSVHDTVALFANTLSPPVSVNSVTQVRANMIRKGVPVFVPPKVEDPKRGQGYGAV